MKPTSKGYAFQRPWDPHTHLRSPAQIGEVAFRRLLHMNTCHYAVVIAEPNTFLDAKHPTHHIFTAEDVLHYHEIVEKFREATNACQIFFLIKLTDTTKPEELDKALALPFVLGVKIYPEGVTTGANHGGVSDFYGKRLQENFAVIAERNKIVQEHPERPGVTSSRREFEYRGILECHVAQNPGIRFFAEHISDRHTLDLVERYHNLFGTITGHHLRLTEDDALVSPDCFCRPHAKDPQDRAELIRAATGKRPTCGNKIISITDSAYHPHFKKHSRGVTERMFETCAGILNPGEIALPDLFALFEEHNCVDAFEQFTSINASVAYNIPLRPENDIEIEEVAWKAPHYYDMNGNPDYAGIPFKAGHMMRWIVAF